MALLRRPRRVGKAPGDVCALLDFGGSGARAAIVRLGPRGAELLGVGAVTGRSGLARPGQVMHRERLAALAERALASAEADTARDSGPPTIADEVFVGLGGPLLEATSHVTHLPRPDPIAPIFEAELHAALGIVQHRTLAEVAERAGASRIRRTLVAAQLVGVRSLRGDTGEAQWLPDPARGVPGLAGDVLSVATCNLTWPTQGLEMLSRVLDDLELTLAATVPLSQAIAATLPVPDAILLDIGEEHTEVALAEGGALNALGTMPLGGNFFTDWLSRTFGVAPKHAALLKLQHGQDDNRPVARELAQAARAWQRELEQVLLRLAGEAPLPSRLFLFGGGAQLPELLRAMHATPWLRRLPFEQPPTIERLLPHRLRGLHDPRGRLNTPAQVGLAALAAWLAREPAALEHHFTRLSRNLALELKLA